MTMRNKVGSVIVTLLLVSGTILMAPLGAQAASSRTYPSKIDGYAASDPATLLVRFHVYNDGTQTVSPQCTVEAQNSSGAYHGFDVFDLNSISAGTTVNASGQIIITGQGAYYVSEVNVSCTAQTTDTGISTGQVKVTSVDPPTTDGFAGHDSTGWYWGAIINVSGVSNDSVVKCTERPLDSNGKVLIVYTFIGTVNTGSVGGSMQDTSALLGSKIKTVSAACQLGNKNPTTPVPSVIKGSVRPLLNPRGMTKYDNNFYFKWGADVKPGQPECNKDVIGCIMLKIDTTKLCTKGVLAALDLYYPKNGSKWGETEEQFYGPINQGIVTDLIFNLYWRDIYKPGTSIPVSVKPSKFDTQISSLVCQ
jgi:hypothetical protein